MIPARTSCHSGSTSSRALKRTVARPSLAVVAPRDPRPLDDADDVGEVEGTVRVQQWRAVVEAREIDVSGIERQHLVVALAGPQIRPAHHRTGRPDDLDSACLGIDGVRLLLAWPPASLTAISFAGAWTAGPTGRPG